MASRVNPSKVITIAPTYPDKNPLHTDKILPISPSPIQQTTLKKVGDQFAQKSEHFPSTPMPTGNAPALSLSETVQIVTVHPPRLQSPDSRARIPSKNASEFTVNFVLETLQNTNHLPDISGNAQRRALVEAALGFALFFNSVKEHLEVCLAIKVYLEAEKDKYNRAEATIPGIEVLANLFFSKKSHIKIFLDRYAREFMKYFQNSDRLCIAFRKTLTKAHGLQIDYRIGSDGKMSVDQTMNQLLLFSLKKRVHAASVTEIIRLFEEELAVKFFLLELEKCLLTLFVKKFELKKLKLTFASGRNSTGIHFTHPHALKQLRTLETQIPVLKRTSQTYCSRYATEIFVKYPLDGLENIRCKDYIDKISAALTSLEQEMSELLASRDTEAHCIIF